MSADPFITLAVVTSPHGVSGRVKIKSFATPPESFAMPALTDESGKPVKLKITGGEGTVYIAAVEGLRRREEADLWRGKKLGVVRSALPKTPKSNEFYIVDLVGIPVFAEDDSAFGIVKDVHNFGGGDILEITKADGSDEMYSFTTDSFPTIDVANRRIVIHPPEIITGKEHE